MSEQTRSVALPGRAARVRPTTTAVARGGLAALARTASSLSVVVALLIAWEVVARVAPSVFFPPFSVIVGQFLEDWFSPDPGALFLSDGFWSSVPVSVSRLARGWGLAVVVGIAIGFVLGRSRIARALYSPVIRFWMSVPNAALLPIALQFFGVTDGMSIFLIAFGTVWLVAMNTADGVAGVDPDWLRSARSLRLPRRILYARVVVPAASPHILAGVRISVSFALVLMIVAELYATTAGLGHDVAVYQQTFQYRKMWSAFLLIALLGIGINLLFDRVERYLLRWQRRRGLAEL